MSHRPSNIAPSYRIGFTQTTVIVSRSAASKNLPPAPLYICYVISASSDLCHVKLRPFDVIIAFWYKDNPEMACRQDATTKQDSENELWWSPFIDADEVSVAVANDVATLTDAVVSWLE